jgi:hypothetical protein
VGPGIISVVMMFARENVLLLLLLLAVVIFNIYCAALMEKLYSVFGSRARTSGVGPVGRQNAQKCVV